MTNIFLKTTNGFTLAEVLITLGIIGVVASLTMPGLIRDYQNKVYETSNLVFENSMGEALRQMNIAEDLTGHATTKDFIEALKKYLKIVEVCEANNLTACFPDKINSSDGEPIEVAKADFIGEAEEWKTGLMGIVLQNGTGAIIKYNPNCQSKGITSTVRDLEHCAMIAYDTNGKSHPNAPNKDIQGDALSAGEIKMVQLNGFQMTESEISYGPIDTTLPENQQYDNKTVTGERAIDNYWAGANKACKELDMELPDVGVASAYSCKDAPNKTFQVCQIYEWCKANGCSNKDYWTSAVYLTDTSIAWYMHHTSTRDISVANKNNNAISVRCIVITK